MKIIGSLIFLCFLSSIVFAQECPVKDDFFENYFQKFISEREFQRKRTVLPLVMREGSGEFQPPTIKLLSGDELAQLTYPLILNDDQRKQDGVDREFSILSAKNMEVFDFIDDADSYKMLYSFREIYGCWYLEEIHDWSE